MTEQNDVPILEITEIVEITDPGSGRVTERRDGQTTPLWAPQPLTGTELPVAPPAEAPAPTAPQPPEGTADTE
jgi:hypothetical protein